MKLWNFEIGIKIRLWTTSNLFARREKNLPIWETFSLEVNFYDSYQFHGKKIHNNKNWTYFVWILLFGNSSIGSLVKLVWIPLETVTFKSLFLYFRFPLNVVLLELRSKDPPVPERVNTGLLLLLLLLLLLEHCGLKIRKFREINFPRKFYNRYFFRELDFLKILY